MVRRWRSILGCYFLKPMSLEGYGGVWRGGGHRETRYEHACLCPSCQLFLYHPSGSPVIIGSYSPIENDKKEIPNEGRLPDATKGNDHLREVFVETMGLEDIDIVTLSGGHTLGGAHKERSGFEGLWTSNPLIFDNSYFIELLAGEKKGLLKLPTDKAVLDDPVFRPLVEKYAADEDAFFADYAISHMKLSELGFAKA
ncbi:unnamed protein product [Lactuca saligna]|uniref:Plant heme peroxidase family profile domain-containing protein n=1 Tax=Lactuca saligna TaxID=75948 RepID=A0AA35ZT62_LACSI|nr:unnamed protein product [Lactuca saligna]